MVLRVLLIFSTALFLFIYGLRSFIAGIKKKKKSYWLNLGYDSGLRKLLKDNYDQVINIFWGFLSLILGLIILVKQFSALII